MEKIILNYLLNEYKDLGQNTFLSAVPKERLIAMSKDLNALFGVKPSYSQSPTEELILSKLIADNLMEQNHTALQVEQDGL